MGCSEDNGRTPPGQPLQVPFTSDSRHQPWLAAGTISASEDAVAAMVVVLLIPAGPTRPVRLLLDFDGSLELAHELIASAARLHRAGRAIP